jgi:hypothetical protein
MLLYGATVHEGTASVGTLKLRYLPKVPTYQPYPTCPYSTVMTLL